MALGLGALLLAVPFPGIFEIPSFLIWLWPLAGLAAAPFVARCEACARCTTLRIGPLGCNLEAFDQTGLQYCLDRLDTSENTE